MNAEPRGPFEIEIPIDAPRDEVWRALSEPRGVASWFAPRVELRPGVGGEVRWRWGELHDWPLRIEVWEPGRKLRLAYDSSVDDGAGGKRPLLIDFHLEGRGGSTVLRLVHSGFGPEADFDQEYDGIGRGWPVELQSLKLYLERHRGQERQVVWRTADVRGSHREVWRQLCGPAALACGEAVDRLAPGAPFAFETADGDRFEGRALCCQPQELAGVATSHGDAFLRLSVENCGGTDQVWLWLGAWGQDEERLEALGARWGAMLERLFAAEGTHA